MWEPALLYKHGIIIRYQIDTKNVVIVYNDTWYVSTSFLADPRRGIPNMLMHRNNQAVQIDPVLLPEPDLITERERKFHEHTVKMKWLK